MTADEPLGSSANILPAEGRAPVLFGRDDIVRGIVEIADPVLLLTGDSGIGKSEVLLAAREMTNTPAAPSPITVGSASGSLQRSLLVGLGEATAQIVQQRGLAAEIGARLTEAAKRLARDSGREAVKVLAQAVLLKIKETAGPEAVELLGRYVQELGEVDHEALLSRINAEADPSVADTIIELSAEVTALAGSDCPIVITLDGAEALVDEDLRVLQDLVPRLPEGVRLRIGFGTYTEDDQDRVENLRVNGGPAVREIALEGVTEDAIRDWLVARGHDPALARELHEQTDGYPFYVDDLISLLSAGETLEPSEAAGERALSDRYDKFVGRTQQAWRRLDAPTQAVARQLAVFSQPLPEPELQRVCGLNAGNWGATVDRLRRARILSSTVNGIPWFHPIRQQAILRLLRGSEREQLDAAARDAIESYLLVARTAQAPELTVNIAMLVAASPLLLEQQPAVRAATELGRSELAVAAALVDLYEPTSGLLNANHILQHARDFFRGHGDLVPTIKALQEAGLIEVMGTDRGVFVRPLFETGTTEGAVIQGRALLELGRLPLPGLVSSIFSAAVDPLVQPFEISVHGMGRARLQEAAETARAMSQAVDGLFAPRGQGHFLFIRARFHDRPITAHIKFATDELRELAQRRTDGLALEVLGGAFVVDQVIPHPGDAVASERFLAVVERVYGRALNRISLSLNLDQPYDLARYMELRVEAMEFIRARSTEEERRAFGLEEVASIHWNILGHDERAYLTEGFVTGGPPRAVHHDDLPQIGWNDPYHFFRYADAFGLAEGERLYRLHHRGGQRSNSDPIVDALAATRADARKVNRLLARVRIDVDHNALRDRLLDARRRELADAEAFHEAFARTALVRDVPVARSLLVGIQQLDPPYVSGRLGFSALEAESGSGEEEVYVSGVQASRGLSWEDQISHFSEQFGVSTGEALHFLHSDATHGVADLLGFQSDDVVLVDSTDMPADAW